MTIEYILGISAALTGAVIGWMAVLKPLCDKRRAGKKAKQDGINAVLENDRAYRAAVMAKLDSMETKIDALDESLAELQRDNIERAYCMFVVEHGYCPSGMKSSIQDMFASYSAKGYNHIAEQRVADIMRLPEFPPEGRKG